MMLREPIMFQGRHAGRGRRRDAVEQQRQERVDHLVGAVAAGAVPGGRDPQHVAEQAVGEHRV